MAISNVILIIAILVIAIWLLYRFKKSRHKILVIFLIALILFSFFSFNASFGNEKISIKNISDFVNLSKVYFSWLGSIFNNFISTTANAIKIDWKSNNTT